MLVLNPSFIVTMDRECRIIKDGFIGIEEGKIVYVSKEKPQEYEEIIRLPKRVLLPGFINTHTHVAMTILRGLKDDVNLQRWLMEYILPVEKLLKPKDVYYGALYGIAEMIKSGTTTFMDMYYHEIEVAKAAADAKIRSVLTYGLADVFFNTLPEEEFKKAEKFKDDLSALVSSRGLDDFLFFAYGPHSPYGCTKELLQIVREAADRDNFRIHIHLSETKSEVENSVRTSNMTPIEYLESVGFLKSDVMAAHVVWPTDGDIEILKHRGVHVLHNPTSNLKLASGVAPVPKFLEKGINVALATDGPASNNRLDMWKEISLAALIHKGISRDPEVIPARTALQMATINGAYALGLERKIGSLEVGKYADFVVVNLERALESVPFHDVYSMIVYALDSRYIDSVWINGELMYSQENVLKTIDVQKLREIVNDIRIRLTQEAGIKTPSEV
ncbi:MAG: amidohydrolase [Crenarchaeota archaeon]|nr:amidohydrolase [Thermoproteota archaeon]MCR8455058.1 amidohydrolase [Thermoproteota archaeon]MCR8501036.1 amidohydrolase [Thermoproteota archaeon]